MRKEKDAARLRHALSASNNKHTSSDKSGPPFRRGLIETMAPVTGFSPEVHHGDDDHAVWLVAVNNCVGKAHAKKPAGNLLDHSVTLRRATEHAQAAFNL